uniref:Uncharacterized protein n=1 Tax=Anguilla anguilla TaxID=7936 RepID=A0A0E9WSM9_ANGAN
MNITGSPHWQSFCLFCKKIRNKILSRNIRLKYLRFTFLQCTVNFPSIHKRFLNVSQNGFKAKGQFGIGYLDGLP